MRKWARVTFAAFAFIAAFGFAPRTVDHWKTALTRFEADDLASPRREGGVVFIGGTTIWLWDVNESFQYFPALNRGVEGALLPECLQHVDRLVLRHKPRGAVLYAGDDEIVNGETPKQVADEFKAFVAAVHKTLPETKIFFLSIKPSVARWKLRDQLLDANAQIEAICQKEANCEFVNVWPKLVGVDGTPKASLFNNRGPGKGLHLTDTGYNVCTNLLRPRLDDLYKTR